jgi:hypothetical protein
LLEEEALVWVEEPTRADDFAGHAPSSLSQSTNDMIDHDDLDELLGVVGLKAA